MTRYHLKINVWMAIFCFIAVNLFLPETNAGEFIVGVGTHFADGKRSVEKSISMIRSVGAASIRDEVYWSNIEIKPREMIIPRIFDSYINKAITTDISPLLILDYGNNLYDNDYKGHEITKKQTMSTKPVTDTAVHAFGNYAAFVVKHYSQKVKIFEIWNEWDHPKRPPTATPESYYNLISHVYPIIKSVDPSAKVIIGSVTPDGILSGWLNKLMSLGVMKYADGVSIHPYVHCNKSEKSKPEYWALWMKNLAGELKELNSGKEVQLYITEMGWPNDTGNCGTSIDIVPQYLSRMYLLAKTIPAIKGVWWYDFQDDGVDKSNREHNYGLVEHDLTPKPSYYAFRDVASLVRKSTFIEKLRTESSLYALKFANDDSSVTLAIWANNSMKATHIAINYSEMAGKKVAIQLIGNGPEWENKVVDRPSGNLSLSVTGTPILVKSPDVKLKILPRFSE